MRTMLRCALLALALLVGLNAHAAALFDPASGMLTLPAVRVGSATYADVRLTLINADDYTFRLQNDPGQTWTADTNITFDANSGVLTIPFVSVGAVAYYVQMQLTDAASYTFRLASAELMPTGSKLYIGYYIEDPTENPEDPTIGGLLAIFPSADAGFEGLMPFSYAGCTGLADIGTVSGTRVAASVTGNWTGTVDRIAVGGSYIGSYDVANDIVEGTYSNAGGKVPFGTGACHGFIAPRGTWKVFGATTNRPSSFAIHATVGLTPQLSWPNAGSALYVVRMFDESCLIANVRSASCFMGEAYTAGVTLAYPAQFPGASRLVSGGRYLVLVVGQSAVNGGLLGFSSLRITP